MFGEHSGETEEGAEKEEVTQVEEKAVEAGEKASKEAPVKGLLQTRLPESVKLQVTWGSKDSALGNCWGGEQYSLAVRQGQDTGLNLESSRNARHPLVIFISDTMYCLSLPKTKQNTNPHQEGMCFRIAFLVPEVDLP